MNGTDLFFDERPFGLVSVGDGPDSTQHGVIKARRLEEGHRLPRTQRVALTRTRIRAPTRVPHIRKSVGDFASSRLCASCYRQPPSGRVGRPRNHHARCVLQPVARGERSTCPGAGTIPERVVHGALVRDDDSLLATRTPPNTSAGGSGDLHSSVRCLPQARQGSRKHAQIGHCTPPFQKR